MPNPFVLVQGLLLVALWGFLAAIPLAAALCVLVGPPYLAAALAARRRFPRTERRLCLAIGILPLGLGYAWAMVFAPHGDNS